MRRVLLLKRKNFDAEPEESFEQPFVVIAPAAFGEAITHFEQGDHRQGDRHPRTHLLAKAMAKRRTAPVHDRDDDVGVEADHSSKKTRRSASSGGSCGMPSG